MRALRKKLKRKGKTFLTENPRSILKYHSIALRCYLAIEKLHRTDQPRVCKDILISTSQKMQTELSVYLNILVKLLSIRQYCHNVKARRAVTAEPT